MGLFKSSEERKIERNIEIRRGINIIKKNIKNLSKYEQEYIKKACKAKQIGSDDQFNFIKQSLKKTAMQRRILERQLLALETAIQIKNQAESQSQFISSLKSLTKSINVAFDNINMNDTQKEFGKALSKAKNLEERMDLFLDISCDNMTEDLSKESSDVEEEIDKWIEEKIIKEESNYVDKEISEEIKNIERELGDI